MGSNETWDRAREVVVHCCRWMATERLVHATSGNVSVRVEDEPALIAMTPAATPYDTLEPADVCIVTLDGDVVDGAKPPTSELPLHAIVYRRRREVRAIVHAHTSRDDDGAWVSRAFLTGLVERPEW
jgi:L-ribulose-5-phosphate 4-epimerase